MATRTNETVAALLREYAELLTITGGDQFRARNYEKAARSVAGHPEDLAGLDPAALQRIPGVGKSTGAKIAEYLQTGTISALEALRGKIPAGVRELTRVPGLGPRRAMQLSRDLGVTNVAELVLAIRAGKLHDLAGFGQRSSERILRGIEVMDTRRVTLDVALDTAATVVSGLSSVTERCEYAGSLRRWRETIGDVDVLATASNAAHAGNIVKSFLEYAGEKPVTEADLAAGVLVGGPADPVPGGKASAVPDVLASGPTKTSIRTPAGLQVDLRIVPADVWGAAMQYFTGSRAHNVAVRAIAVKAGLKLSEYGLQEQNTLLAARTETDVYNRLGMAWIPPAMREDTGEVQAALRDDIPSLVEQRDIRGDLHTHTNLTDGVASLADMITAAQARGYEYYAVTDHAPDLLMQRMTDEKTLAQREELNAFNSTMALLHGSELNIAADGSVDWDAGFLAGFDICVASVHSHFDQDRATMTRRFITACENPCVNIIGHPLTRRFGRRAAVEVNFGELFRACARTGTALEVNASPQRLDLPAEHIRAARDAGVVFAINTDAHSVRDLDFVRYGIGTAQRGWLTPDDVINAWPLAKLRDFVARKRSR